jgi:hypothetical protein
LDAKVKREKRRFDIRGRCSQRGGIVPLRLITEEQFDKTFKV